MVSSIEMAGPSAVPKSRLRRRELELSVGTPVDGQGLGRFSCIPQANCKLTAKRKEPVLRRGAAALREVLRELPRRRKERLGLLASRRRTRADRLYPSRVLGEGGNESVGERDRAEVLPLPDSVRA